MEAYAPKKPILVVSTMQKALHLFSAPNQPRCPPCYSGWGAGVDGHCLRSVMKDCQRVFEL